MAISEFESEIDEEDEEIEKEDEKEEGTTEEIESEQERDNIEEKTEQEKRDYIMSGDGKEDPQRDYDINKYIINGKKEESKTCLLYTSPSPRDRS